MNDEKVYSPEVIQEQPFPATDVLNSFDATQQATKTTFSPSVIKEQKVQAKRIAVELIGSVLNTKSRKILKEFQFTETGAIQIGKYQSGTSGDVKISPDGITARNSSGLYTFAIDADTGDAVFMGTIQAGALISGAVSVGDGKILIDGDTKRIVFYDDDNIPSIVIGEI